MSQCNPLSPESHGGETATHTFGVTVQESCRANMVVIVDTAYIILLFTQSMIATPTLIARAVEDFFTHLSRQARSIA